MSSVCPRWGEGLAPPAALMMMMTRVRRASWARAGRSGWPIFFWALGRRRALEFVPLVYA